MNTQTTEQPLSAGCLDQLSWRDGDIGTRVQSAVCGQEAYSINRTNSPPDKETSPVPTLPTRTQEPRPATSEDSSQSEEDGWLGEISYQRGLELFYEVSSDKELNWRSTLPPIQEYKNLEEETAGRWEVQSKSDKTNGGTIGPPKNQTPAHNKTNAHTKGYVKIATLNMRGHRPVLNMNSDSPMNKWLYLNRLIRENKIGILALQEMHMSDDIADKIKETFGKRIHLLRTEDPTQQNARGVAIIINKEMIKHQEITSKVIIEGRALSIRIPWGQNRNLEIMAIYAPNAPAENRDFWWEIQEKINQKEIAKPNIMLGNFNLVKDMLDRLPSHNNNLETVRALRELKADCTLIDGWRYTYPNQKQYMYTQKATKSMSRIDRIYMKEQLLTNSVDWQIVTDTNIDTDHMLTSTSRY